MKDRETERLSSIECKVVADIVVDTEYLEQEESDESDFDEDNEVNDNEYDDNEECNEEQEEAAHDLLPTVVITGRVEELTSTTQEEEEDEEEDRLPRSQQGSFHILLSSSHFEVHNTDKCASASSILTPVIKSDKAASI